MQPKKKPFMSETFLFKTSLKTTSFLSLKRLKERYSHSCIKWLITFHLLYTLHLWQKWIDPLSKMSWTQNHRIHWNFPWLWDKTLVYLRNASRNKSAGTNQFATHFMIYFVKPFVILQILENHVIVLWQSWFSRICSINFEWCSRSLLFGYLFL